MVRRIEREGRPRRERALLVGLELSARDGQGSDDPGLAELALLATTAGARVAGVVVQRRRRIDPAFYVGRGKAREIASRVRAERHDVVLFANELSPRQARNLEDLFRVRVIDRTELILDIFAQHARTAPAQAQVELAQLQYCLPRLRRLWPHLSRIQGGVGTHAAGVASRGPGEKQLEMDRRQLRRRVTELRSVLATVVERHERKVEHRSELFTVSLVGYTNAGKSTLLNALTGSRAAVADRLFSTLDTLTRIWTLPQRRRVLLSDTVGFIRRLPHNLIASFQATLAETRSADLLLHVVDAARSDAFDQIRAVDDVLSEIGALERPTLMVFNKSDRIENATDLRILENSFPRHVVVSAATGAGLDALTEAVTQALESTRVEIEVHASAGDGKLFALLREHGSIHQTHFADGDRARVRAAIDPREEGRLRRHLAEHGGSYHVLR